MRIEDTMLIPLGETLKLYDDNHIRDVIIVLSNNDEGEEEFLCVDTMTYEVIWTFTEKTFDKVYLVKQENFNIKEEILKCISDIRIQYPNEEIFFSDYQKSSFIEIYRQYKKEGELITHTALLIDYTQTNSGHVKLSLKDYINSLGLKDIKEARKKIIIFYFTHSSQLLPLVFVLMSS